MAVDKETQQAFDIVSKYLTSNKSLINFAIVVGLLAISLIFWTHQIPVVGEGESIKYINATYINSTGFSETGTVNTTINLSTGLIDGTYNQSTPLFAISELNNQSFYGNESNGVPWTINVTFTNITKFNNIDVRVRYFSDTGTPSSHEVFLLIWCPKENEWTILKDYGNLPFPYGRQYEMIDSMHYIDQNGTVLLKFLHPANGNINHIEWIDVFRLINEKY